MSTTFNQIPPDELRPDFYVELSNERAAAGPSNVPHHVLVIGQKIAAGAAGAGEIVQITNDQQGDLFGGQGSQLAEMINAYRSASGRVQMSALVLADTGAGTAAVKRIAFVGTATEAGEIVLRMGSRVARAAVAVGDTATVVAATVKAAVDGVTRARFTAANSAGNLDLTAKNKGTCGTRIPVSINYRGESLPAGITATITTETSGAGDPDLDALSVAGILGGAWFTGFVNPYVDDDNIGYLNTEITDRWRPERAIGGVQFVGHSGDFATIQSWGAAKNSQFLIALDFGAYQTAPDENAADFAGTAIQAINIDPSRPTKTLVLPWVLPPVSDAARSPEEIGLLLKSGVACCAADAGGDVRIVRTVTTYKTGSTGAPGPSYRDAETVYLLQAMSYSIRNHFLNKFPRHKLASSGANFPTTAPVITEATARSEVAAVAWTWESEFAWIEDSETFAKEGIRVWRPTTDRDRLNFVIDPDLINKFMVGAMQIRFIL